MLVGEQKWEERQLSTKWGVIVRGTGKRNAMGNVVSEGDVNYGVEDNAFFYNLHSEDGHLIEWNNQQSLQVVVECS